MVAAVAVVVQEGNQLQLCRSSHKRSSRRWQGAVVVVAVAVAVVVQEEELEEGVKVVGEPVGAR